jgi:glycosyltransferase involved in cell wall biosynthesis
MKVLQLIDTLETGGAERVAVNFANALVAKVDASYLCTTRREGTLKSNIETEVGYIFLGRKSTFDVTAVKTLNMFVKHEQITHIHAHATSFFIATIIKIFNPKLKLIWHDHYGESEFLNQRPKTVLKFCSKFFDHLFCVNSKLKDWATTTLKTKSINHLPNYAVLDNQPQKTVLKGTNGKRIICLANLRPQKDHVTLLKAFKTTLINYPGWTLHLVGKDFKDAYSNTIKTYITAEALEHSVFIYDSCSDVSAVLKQSSIGVLSSKSEGLPLAILEYGLAALPVIATNVGDCNLVISNETYGKLIPSKDVSELKNAIEYYISNTETAKLAGKHLKLKIENDFSKHATIKNVVAVYKSL